MVGHRLHSHSQLADTDRESSYLISTKTSGFEATILEISSVQSMPRHPMPISVGAWVEGGECKPDTRVRVDGNALRPTVLCRFGRWAHAPRC
jgi:hypothetical protein